MFLSKLFKFDNKDYEGTLINNGVNSFNKNLTILVIADTHGDLAFNKQMQKKLKKFKFDLCCVLGDIGDDYKIILDYVPKDKIVAILGNHDRFSLLDEYGLYNYNGKIVNINGIRIGAIEGSFKYKDETFPSFTHKESINFLEKMSDVDILLSHDKPFTINNNIPAHDGLKGITKYLYERKVPINIHGHIHKSYLKTLKNGTQVKSVYGIEVIKLKNGRIEMKQGNKYEIYVYQSEQDKYIKMKLLGKLKYVGKPFSDGSLTDGKVYDCVGYNKEFRALSIVNENEENYMYFVDKPRPLNGSSKGGEWEVVEIYDKCLEQFLNTRK